MYPPDSILCSHEIHQDIINRTENRTREGWLTLLLLASGVFFILGLLVGRWL